MSTSALEPWYRVVQDKWWILPLAFTVSLMATPIVRYVAYKNRIVDKPDDLLKPHSRPVAYLGGVAMCLGVLSGLLSYTIVMPEAGQHWTELGGQLMSLRIGDLINNPAWNLLLIMLAAVVITAVGLLDDLRDIAPRTKVLGQLLAAGFLVAGGMGLKTGLVILGPLGLAENWLLLYPLSVLACMVLVIGCCNATNLLDGLDGLCGGVSAIIGAGFLVLTVWLATYHNVPLETDGLRITLCMAMVGGTLGFLPYNAHPASIFMGDAGSMLLGFLAAALMVLFCQEGTPRWLLAAGVIFGVPLMDTSLAVVRRLLAGRHIFAGDRSHLYDQLIDRGMSLKGVVGLFYVLSIVAALVGLSAGIYLRMRYALIIYVVLFVGVWVVFHLLGFIREKSPAPSAAGESRGIRPKHMAAAKPLGAGQTLNLLFTSVGRRVSLVEQFRRAGQELGLRMNIHAVDCQAIAPGLQVADHASVVPPVADGEAYLAGLESYCRANEIGAVIPLIDTELPLLSGNRARMEATGARLILSNPDVVRISADKKRTHDFLRENGFRTPRILQAGELENASFPVFMKPLAGSASVRARRVDNAEELAYFRDCSPLDVVQEYVEGVEYTTDVFVDFNGEPRCAVPRRRHEIRGGEVSKSQAVRHRGIIDECYRLARALGGCRGMINIQCFLTPEEEIVFIEVNPRFGGGVPLSIRAGADSPRWLLELLLGREPKIDPEAWTDGLYMLRYDEAFFVLPQHLPK